MPKKNTSPKFDLLVFCLVFGWEGPAGIIIGFRDGNLAAIIVGFFITVFLWGVFGIEHLKECMKGN